VALRFGRLGLLIAGALLSAALAGAQQVAIEHQDVACIVAGQFPVLDACFRPGPGLARARVYFRPEGASNWYYVDASAAPPRVDDAADLVCRRATLPKPKKSLIEKHVEYYVDATGRKQESSQTETFRPLVVKNEGDCKKKVAGFVPNAVVTVFPSLPAAFTVGGGLSGAAVAALVGAGVAGGTGVVIAATNGGGSSSPTTTNPPVATVPPATVPPTTTTTTLAPSVPFNPVFKVFQFGVLEPGNKIAGKEPVQLRFYMCESTGPLPLKYNVLVNGGIVTAGCDSTITFKTGGFFPGFGGVAAQGLAPSASYDVLMRMQSDGPGNNPKDSRALTVDVTAAPPTTTTTTFAPFSGPVPGLLPPSGNEVHLQETDRPPATWVSQLEVPGGRGQVVLNGSEAQFPAAGRAPLSVRPRAGDNRVEAQLVQAQGRAGLWRFELAGDRAVAGSLRVIAGQVALVTGDVVVFRLKGQPGERVVFTFTGR
jgi:hypothetical protein